MKKMLYLALLLLILLSACVYKEDKYTKCFFLGEESFYMEGRIYNNTSFLEIDSLVIGKYNFNSFTSDDITQGKIIFNNIINNEFQLMIDIKNFEAFDEDYFFEGNILKTSIEWLLFPEDFPVYILNFHTNVITYGKTTGKINFGYKLNYYAKGNDKGYEYVYVYVAKPINLTGTYEVEYPINFTSEYLVYHQDLNFSKSGWYKVVYSRRNKNIENDPIFSSGKDTTLWLRNY